MNIKTLKTNRNQIIETITNRLSESEVKNVMEIMVNFCDEDMVVETIEEYIEYCLDVYEQKRFVKKDSELTIAFCKAHENEKFNHLTKTWSKI